MIIDFKRLNIDLSDYPTTEEVEQMIQDAAISGITIDLSDYYTSAQTETAISTALNGYATETWVNSQGYLTEHQSLSAYSTTDQMNQAIATAKSEVESEIPTNVSQLTNDAGYLTQHQSLADYYTSAQTNSQIENAIAAETARTESTYLKEHQSLSAYSTTEQVQDMIDGSISGIPTEFKTINNQSIIGSGNITIEGGGSYTAGSNIDITNDVISVTGITVPTKTSDLNNDSGYITSGQAQTQIDNSLSGYATETWVEGKGYLTEHQSLSNYYTKSEVDTKIADIDVSDQLQPIKDDISDLKAADITINQTLVLKADKSEIPTVPTSNTAFTNDAGYVTSGEVETQIMDKNYTTSAETQTQINNSLSGYATETWVSSQGYLTEHQSLADYYTSAQTDTKIAEAISEIDLSEIEGEISTLSGKVQTNEEVTAAALIELHNEISAITIPDVSSFVVGDGITTIKKISQADYDALVSGGTVDSNCFYAITGTTN